MAGALAVAERRTAPDGAARIALQVWGESQRDAALAEFVADRYREIRSRFVHLVRRAQVAGEVPAEVDPERLGAVLFGALLGYIMQQLLVGDLDPAAYRAGLRPLLDFRAPART
jgi:hypothetical protein